MSSEVNAAAEVAHHVASEPLTPTAYIAEHLQNLNNIGGAQTSVIDFSVINLDTIFWTSLMGLITVFLLVLDARRASPGVPGRFLCLVEMLVEMVDNQTKSIVHGDRTFIAPHFLLRTAHTRVLTAYLPVFLSREDDNAHAHARLVCVYFAQAWTLLLFSR